MTEPYKPEWAKRLEEWGKGMEAKYGRRSVHPSNSSPEEWNSDDSFQQTPSDKEHYTHHAHRWSKDPSPSWQRQNNPVGTIVGDIISYFIITYAPLYFPTFFLSGYSAVRIVIILSILVHISVSLVLLIIPIRPLYYLGHTIMNLAGLTSMVVMVSIFPFNVPYGLGYIVQIALWIAIAIVAIVTLFEFLNIFGSDSHYEC